MKFYLVIFLLLTFFSQNAFSQDYSKMSANEKAKVIIYGDNYPYSLLLESGSDTLHLYQISYHIDLHLIFEEGKLIQVNDKEGKITKYIYEEGKLIREELYAENDTTYFITAYRNDSLVYFIISPEIVSFERDYLNSSCSDWNEGQLDFCVYYKQDTMFHGFQKWIFEKDRIVTEFRPPMRTSFYFDNQQKIFFVKDGYVNFLTENFFIEEQLENEFSEGDFITEEKNELKIKILKSPKDKPKREKIAEND